MGSTAQILLAAGVGYALGRRKKLKLAAALATYYTMKKLKIDPQALMKELKEEVTALPVVDQLKEETREQLVGVGKDTTDKLVSKWAGNLADSLNDRAEQLRGGSAGAAGEQAAEPEGEESEAEEASEEEPEAEEDSEEDPEAEEASEEEPETEEASEEPAAAQKTSRQGSRGKSAQGKSSQGAAKRSTARASKPAQRKRTAKTGSASARQSQSAEGEGGGQGG